MVAVPFHKNHCQSVTLYCRQWPLPKGHVQVALKCLPYCFHTGGDCQQGNRKSSLQAYLATKLRAPRMTGSSLNKGRDVWIPAMYAFEFSSLLDWHVNFRRGKVARWEHRFERVPVERTKMRSIRVNCTVSNCSYGDLVCVLWTILSDATNVSNQMAVHLYRAGFSAIRWSGVHVTSQRWPPTLILASASKLYRSKTVHFRRRQ